MAPSTKTKRQYPENHESPTGHLKRRCATRKDYSTKAHVYEIKSIIDERQGQYKIDWADDPITGKAYRPTWEPKANASCKAVRAWKEKKELRAGASKARALDRKIATEVSSGRAPSNPLDGSSSRSLRSNSVISVDVPLPTRSGLGLATPRSSHSRSSEASLSPLGTDSVPEDRGEWSQDRLACKKISSPALAADEIEDSYEHQPDVPDSGPAVPDLFVQPVVQVAQPPGFHRDQYSSYPSSLATQPSGSTQSQPSVRLDDHPVPSLSSSVEARHRYSIPVVFDREGIVPDLQSLPGSSSFVPSTLSRSISSSASHGSSVSFTGQSVYASSADASGSLPASLSVLLLDASDSIEDYSSPRTNNGARAAVSATSAAARNLVDGPPSVLPSIEATSVPLGQLRQTLKSSAERTTPASVQVPNTTQDSGETLPNSASSGEAQIAPDSQRSWVTVTSSSSSSLSKAPSARVSSTNRSCASSQLSQCAQIAQDATAFASTPQSTGLDLEFQTQELLNLDACSGPHGPSPEDHSQTKPFAPKKTSSPCSSQNSRKPTSTLAASQSSTLGHQANIPRSQEDHTLQSAQIVPRLDRSQSETPLAREQLRRRHPGRRTKQRLFSREAASSRGRDQAPQPTFSSSQHSSSSRQSQGTPRLTEHDWDHPRTSHHQGNGQRLEDSEKVVDPSPRERWTNTPGPEHHRSSSSLLPFPSSDHPSSGKSKSPPILIRSARTSMSEPTGSVPTPGGSNLAEKLRNLRAAGVAKTQAREAARASARAATKSPSVIPERQPAPVPEIDEPKTSSLRDQISTDQETSLGDSDVPVLDTTEHMSPTMSQQVADNVSAAGAPVLGSHEYIVPLAMNARIRDQYQQILFNHREDIEDFTRAEGDVEPALISRLKDMVQRVKNVTVHPDLEDEGTLSQPPVLPEEEAKWAESCSNKFVFLRSLIELMRKEEKHLAIMARPGQTLDIIETFLKGIKIPFLRPDTRSKSHASDDDASLRVTLLSTGESETGTILSPAAAVIIMDNTLDMNDHRLRVLRRHLFNADELSPLISLVVMSSVEHVELSVSQTLDAVERLQAVVSCITHTRNDVGQLPDDYPNAAVSAQMVRDFLVDNSSDPTLWSLPTLGEISGLDLLTDPEGSEISATQSSTQPDVDMSNPQAQNPTSLKRSLPPNEDLNSESPKKARLTPIDTESAIGETNATSVPTFEVVDTGVQGRDTVIPATNTNVLAERHKGSDERSGSPTEEELARLLHESRQRVEDHVRALSDLQFRFEEQVAEIRRLRSERDVALASKAQLERQRELRVTEVSNLKDERSRLQTELATASNALQSSAIPELAELAKARAETQEAMLEKTRLEQRLASTARDFEFTRAQYQTASTAAAEASTEVTALCEEMAVLRQKASGEATKLRALTMDSAGQQHMNRIRELELMLADREEQLHRKEEELRQQAKGRGVATRASSVPQSPSQRPAQPLSRATSPNLVAGTATGPIGKLLGHPLRYGLDQ